MPQGGVHVHRVRGDEECALKTSKWCLRSGFTARFSRAADSLDLSQPAVSLAVKRVEEELEIRIFDRSGPSVTLTPDGERVVRGFERVMEILRGIKGRHAENETMRVGLSPLLSGRDVARMLGHYFQSRAVGFAVEFMDSEEIATRSDFDIKVMIPGLRRRSSVQVEFQTRWIGVDNGVFIRSRQEAAVWDRAMHTLLDNRIHVTKGDRGQRLRLCLPHGLVRAGFTPCVMSNENSFQAYVLNNLPPLSPIRLDIFADPDVAELLRCRSAGPRASAGRASPSRSRDGADRPRRRHRGASRRVRHRRRAGFGTPRSGRAMGRCRDAALTVREQPDPGAAAIGTIAAGTSDVIVSGTTVEIDGPAWWQVVLPGVGRGWVEAAGLAAPTPRPETGYPVACVGTEPFWSIDLRDGAAAFTDMSTDTARASPPARSSACSAGTASPSPA